MTRRTSLSLLLVLLAVVLGAASPFARPLWREHALRGVPRPLDVLLITLDTTRADHLGCYGAAAAETPSLDGLARRGVRFLNAYAHVPLTAPSHASILTGLFPTRHGLRDNGGFVLGEEIPTLADQFVKAGYRTGAFVSAFVLDRRFGLARGFGTYEDDVLGGGRERFEAEVKADVTVDRAIRWLAADDPRPFLAWVHLYDPHTRYEPPEPYASRHKGRPYDGEIAYMDSQIGRLLTAASARGSDRPLLILAMGDHGEALGEHGEPSHSYFIYSATQHVPLVLSLPGYLPEGRLVAPVVRGVDVMPTLLDIADIPIQDGLDGRSLVPLITGRASEEPGSAYLESYQPRALWAAHELLGLRTGPWLYIRSPRPELYDVEKDPGESRNLAFQRPQDVESLDARLARFASPGDPLAARSSIDPETEERLRALGYLAGGAAPAPSGPLPDAKENGVLLSGVTRGRELMEDGKLEEAVALFRETLRLSPRSAALRQQLANALVGLGELDEALSLLAELVVEYPREERYALGLALAETRRGRRAQALRVLDGALALLPESSRLNEEAGALLLQMNRLPEATSRLQKAVQLAPRQLAPRLRLGAALARSGKLVEASAALRAAVALSPSSQEAKDAAQRLVLVAGELLRADNPEEARLAYRAALEGGVRTDEAYLNLGLICYRTGRRGEALEVVVEGARQRPESADLRYRAGRLLADAGRTAEAEAEYRKALELVPSRLDARLALATLLQSASRTAEAAELYRQIIPSAGGRQEGRTARAALEAIEAAGAAGGH